MKTKDLIELIELSDEIELCVWVRDTETGETEARLFIIDFELTHSWDNESGSPKVIHLIEVPEP